MKPGNIKCWIPSFLLSGIWLLKPSAKNKRCLIQRKTSSWRLATYQQGLMRESLHIFDSSEQTLGVHKLFFALTLVCKSLNWANIWNLGNLEKNIEEKITKLSNECKGGQQPAFPLFGMEICESGSHFILSRFFIISREGYLLGWRILAGTGGVPLVLNWDTLEVKQDWIFLTM